MEVTETKTVTVTRRRCDFCERQPVGQTCAVCGRDVCPAHATKLRGVGTTCPACVAVEKYFLADLEASERKQYARDEELSAELQKVWDDWKAEREAVLARWRERSRAVRSEP